MAEEVGNLKVKLALDGADFQRSMASVDRSLKTLGQEMRINQNRGKEWGQSLQGLSTRKEALGRLLTSQELKVRKLNESYQAAVKEQGANSVAAENLATKLNKAQAEYQRTETEISQVNAELSKLRKETAYAESSFGKLGDSMRDAGKKIQDVGKKMRDVGKDLSLKVTAPIVAMGTLATKSAIDFESAFAGVRKTVDGTEEEFAQLEKGIRSMAKELPASTTEISAVAEAAGQLGIQKENILAFTRTMIDLGESTNLTADEAATAFARFANIVGMPQENFDRLGSSVVALGNSMATTEAEIVSMGMRLSGTGAQIGLTEAQIMALSAAMSSVGIEAEAGGTAMSTVMKKIQNAVSDGGEELSLFAKASGLSAKDFTKTWNENPIVAIDSFIKGLAKSSSEGKNLNGILENLGIKGIRESDTLLRLAGASDLLSQAVNTASTAWDENNALTNEAAQRYATTESQLAMMKNTLNDLGITIGGIIVPVLLKMLKAVKPIIERFAELDRKTQTTIVIIGGLAAAIGPLLVVVGVMASSLGAIIGTLGTFSSAISVAKTGAVAATPAIGLLAKGITLLTGPVGLAIAGIAALGVGTFALVKYFKSDALPEVDRFGDSLEGVSDSTKVALDGFFELSDGIGMALSEAKITSEKVTQETVDGITTKYNEMNQQIVTGLQERHQEEMQHMRDFFLNSSVLNDEEEKKILEKKQKSHDDEIALEELKKKRIQEVLQLAADENRALTEGEVKYLESLQQQAQDQAVKILSESEIEQKIIMERLKETASIVSAEQAAEVAKNSAMQRDESIQAANDQYDQTLAAIIRMRDETGDVTAEQAEKLIAEAKKQRDESVKYAESMHEDIVKEAKAQAVEHVNTVDWETGEILSKWQVFKNDVSSVMEATRIVVSAKFEQMRNDSVKKGIEIANAAQASFEGLRTAVVKKMGEAVIAVSNGWRVAQTVLENVDLLQIGKDIIGGLVEGIKGSFQTVTESVTGLAGIITRTFRSVMQIFSPSRVTRKDGQWVGKGTALGIKDTYKENKDVMNGLGAILISESARVKKTIEEAEKSHGVNVAAINNATANQIREIKLKAKDADRKLTAAELRKIEKLESESNAKVQAEKKKHAEAIKKIEADASSQRLAAIKKFADDKKAVEELSLIDEVNLWRKSIEQFKAGTAERIEAEKNYKNALQRVNDEVVRINQTYADKMKAINDDLVAQEKSLTAAYEQMLEQRTKSLFNSTGLFERFSSEVEVSGEQLLANLQSQVDGFKNWQDQLTDLSGRGINDELLAELRDLGPKALPQLIALNSMTDEQLSKYSATYEEKAAQARQEAEKQLKGMKDDTARQIDELRSVANQKLLALKDEWTAQIRSVTEATKTEFKTLNQIGIEAGQNLLDGLKSMEGSLVSTATAIAQAVNKALGDTLVRGVSMPGINGTTASLGNAVANAYGSMANSARKVASTPGSIINNISNGNQNNQQPMPPVVLTLDGKQIAAATYDPIMNRWVQDMTVANNSY